MNELETLDNFHDGYFLAIHTSGDSKDITLLLKSRKNVELNLMLSQVKHLRCNNFLEGNIVFSAKVHTKVLVSIEKLLWLLDEDKEKPYIKELQDKVLSGELTFFEIIPSYGAELAAIAKSITPSS